MNHENRKQINWTFRLGPAGTTLRGPQGWPSRLISETLFQEFGVATIPLAALPPCRPHLPFRVFGVFRGSILLSCRPSLVINCAN